MHKISIKSLYLITLSLNVMLYSMEKEETSWNMLPIELKTHILSLVPDAKIGTGAIYLTDIIKTFTTLAMVNNELKNISTELIHNPQELENAVKAYIENYPNFARHELCYGVRNDQIKEVKILIKSGIDINLKDNDGWTPLMHAAHLGKVNMVKLLTEAGADITANKSGTTALVLANRARNSRSGVGLH